MNYCQLSRVAMDRCCGCKSNLWPLWLSAFGDVDGRNWKKELVNLFHTEATSAQRTRTCDKT